MSLGWWLFGCFWGGGWLGVFGVVFVWVFWGGVCLGVLGWCLFGCFGVVVVWVFLGWWLVGCFWGGGWLGVFGVVVGWVFLGWWLAGCFWRGGWLGVLEWWFVFFWGARLSFLWFLGSKSGFWVVSFFGFLYLGCGFVR